MDFMQCFDIDERLTKMQKDMRKYDKLVEAVLHSLFMRGELDDSMTDIEKMKIDAILQPILDIGDEIKPK